jgi:hypothetical protein
VLKYFRPESGRSVTTVEPRPSRAATRIAATTFAPDEVPAKRASSQSERGASALKRLDSPITGSVEFRASLEIQEGPYRNGFIAFGDGIRDKDLVKAGVFVGGRSEFAIFDGHLSAGKIATASYAGDPWRRFEFAVTVHVSTGRVILREGDQTVELTLQRSLPAVTHIGYVVRKAKTAFSQIDVILPPQ